MNNTDVPIWEKYTLTIEEASKYFRIGEKKLRKLAEENIGLMSIFWTQKVKLFYAALLANNSH